MTFSLRSPLLWSLAAFAAALPLGRAADWPELSRDNKPWTRWWWPGSAVDKENLTRELESFAKAGIGGVEITPIYGAKGAEDRFVPFLSDRYIEMIGHVTAEAKRLGLGVDMATGTGWPFGGPQVGPDDVELKIAFKDGKFAPVPTGFKVKRSAPGGAGPVLNPYSTEALRRYLAPFNDALSKLPAGSLNGQFHDSFEYTANWAKEVPARFQELHGYNLLDHTDALQGKGDSDTVARIKADYRTTLNALHLDYVRAWVNWCHVNNWVAREQAHGSPGNLLDIYGTADIPETEIFGSLPFPIPGFRRDPAEIGRDGHPQAVHRFAASAAHVMGRQYASSETFTWLREHFHEAPSEMKPELDLLFLAGINRIFYHGTAYSPADAGWPGWLFYASTQLNPRNPLWDDLGGLHTYIGRVQSFLQAGKPDSDLLVYWPVHDIYHTDKGYQRQLTVHGTDWLEGTPTGEVIEELASHGFAFDLISDDQLAQVKFESDALVAPGGGRYKAIVVPKTGHMPVETMKQLLALADAGTRVYFVDALPSDVPGYAKLSERRAQLAAEVAKIQLKDLAKSGSGQTRHAAFGQGQIYVCTEIKDASLRSFLVSGKSNVRMEPISYDGIQFIRRAVDGGHVYFIANLTAKPIDQWVPITSGGEVTILDPLSGRTGLATRHGPAVYLQLQPGESLLLRTSATVPAGVASWSYRQPAGLPIGVYGPWKLTFTAGGPELPAPRTVTYPQSWTTGEDAAVQTFAGTGRYETTFELPANVTATDWELDLGDVRETARVFVNGKAAGLLWAVPYRARVGALLQPGANTLAIEVTNLAANRIRDLDKRGVTWKNFHEINFVNIFYEKFDAAKWPLQPSGLLGPVTLTPLSAPKL